MATGWRRAGAIVLMVVAAAGSGCRSFRSRRVSSPRDGREIGGVPVVVQVPRYLKVTYKTADYVVAAKSTAPETEAGLKPTSWQVLGWDRRPEVTTEIVSVGELYAVDVDRPFAGTAKNKLEFQDGTHALKSVANDVDDQTFAQATTALEKLVVPFVPGGPAKAQAGDAPKGSDFEVVKVRETIDKIELRDIDDPTCVVATYCPSGCPAPASGSGTVPPMMLLPAPR